jgi:hypothetical protein
MPSIVPLPGFDRLLEVVRKYEIEVELLPAGHAPPLAGEMLAGRIVDPMLAATYARVGKLGFKPWRSLLIRCDDEVNGLLLENQEWDSFWPHPFWPEHFRQLMLFGSNMGYRYATVPTLAGTDETQPIVYLDSYESIYALPVASSLDRFFETYSRYLELLVNDPAYESGGEHYIDFPWEVPELLGGDQFLKEMLSSGAFDKWMLPGDVGNEEAIRKWVSRVLQEH